MYDSGKIMIGLIIFLVLITFPIWYNVLGGKATYVPELQKAAKGPQCVAPTEYMRDNHMEVLDQWRESVVRGDQRFMTLSDGRVIEKSLTHACLDCHQSKEKFCDQCHNYLSVSPYCWDCHVDPKEAGRGTR